MKNNKRTIRTVHEYRYFLDFLLC